MKMFLRAYLHPVLEKAGRKGSVTALPADQPLEALSRCFPCFTGPTDPEGRETNCSGDCHTFSAYAF